MNPIHIAGGDATDGIISDTIGDISRRVYAGLACGISRPTSAGKEAQKRAFAKIGNAAGRKGQPDGKVRKVASGKLASKATSCSNPNLTIERDD